MAPKRRHDDAPPPAADFAHLTDAEVAAIARALRGLEAAIKARERALRGETGVPVEQFDEMIEELRLDLELARRASHGERPH